MRLYKLFEDIIFEEVSLAKTLLTENVSEQDVIDAINGKYNVNILYDDYPDAVPSVPPSKRYIQVYNLGNTKAGNKAIRAFQIGGGSKTTTEGSWKMFRLDRIRGWFPTKVKWKRPVSDLSPDIPKYNKNGDRAMLNVTNKVTIGDYDKYTPDTTRSRPLTPQERSQLDKKPTVSKNTYLSSGDPNPKKEKIDTSTTTKPVVPGKEKQKK